MIGFRKSEAERDIEIAKNLLRAGLAIDVIAKITGLSIVEINKLSIS
jgi:hypothetical protein